MADALEGITVVDLAGIGPGVPLAANPRLHNLFRSRTRDEWCVLLEDTDACFAPAPVRKSRT